MFDGYPLRKYDWKDWTLMILVSSIILQIVAVVLMANFTAISSNLDESGAQAEFLLEVIAYKGTFYGTVISLPLTLWVVYQRKIPLFNRRGLSKEESFIVRGLTKEDWKFLLKYIPISYIIYTAGSGLLAELVGESEAANQMAIESMFSYIPAWQLFIMIVVVAPITEELLFRGMVLFAGDRIETTWLRAVISALAFGLVHTVGETDIFTLYTYIGMGVIITYGAKKTNSIEAGIVYHVLNNLLGFMMIIWFG